MRMRHVYQVLQKWTPVSRWNAKRCKPINIVLLAVLLLTGVARAQFSGPALDQNSPVNVKLVPTTDPAILYPVDREIVLGQGDLLTIRLYGLTDYSPTARISLDGSIQLPLVGNVQVEGLTLHQAQDLIAKRLTDAKMYLNPQVSIQLMESPNEIVTVTGELHGVFPVTGGKKRLFDVLAAAGGLPVTASHTVVIHRSGVPEPIIVDLGTNPAMSEHANVPVFSRDTIIVSRVGVVYLLGAFKNQGAVPIQQNAPLTLMQIAALGGGAGYEGRFEDLRIIRTTGTERTIVTVDIKKVIRGKIADPVLQADDIVFLPTNTMKAAIKGGGISTILGIASVLLYSFAR
jgi:polysaccharide export outer membrane protein